MKRIICLFLFGFINFSFIQPENEPVYKIYFSSTDCYFEILINNKTIYKNENQYSVKRIINIDKYLEKQDSQTIYYTIRNRHTAKSLTEKSKLEILITKNLEGKTDTIFQADMFDKGFQNEK